LSLLPNAVMITESTKTKVRMKYDLFICVTRDESSQQLSELKCHSFELVSLLSLVY